ncbi:DUF349 domain-containing protein [Rufibacter glacialis]|uniref:DUF349 domain-containing protein n=1 Tax=Rufibacter glacialis TaxID=1259555 RepID=A0A5M8QES7_9BACT|nr:DUF349 domain-containing protein [Rufibacter glacialis]KAA6433256.1 DUF349 domain-containing protein [Rufibacter glacialis]GGK76071.1 hypothetical protein GCM10011405_24840 [Rufibacter glacialis]
METKDLSEEAHKYGYIEGNQVWLKPFMHFPARQVGDVKEVPEESLHYFAHRFENFKQKVDSLLEKIETSENKGSFLMKVLHLKEQIEKYDAIGDFESLHQRLSAAEEEIKEAIARNRDKNLSTKITLIQQAEALQTSIDWQETTDKLKELRQNWIKTGPVDKTLTDELEERFKTAVEAFFTRKKEFFQDKKDMLSRTVDKYKALIAQSESVKNSEEWEETSKKLKDLQNQWKEIGGTLPRKMSNDLWNSFRAANNHFFERLKKHINSQKNESKDKYLEDNLEKKKSLVAQAEALLDEPVQQAVPKAKELQAAWKKVGPVKQEESDAVWESFLVACDKIFELSSLEHFMRKRPLPEGKNSENDQLHARINALRDFIKYDKQELEVLETNLGRLNPNPGNETFRAMLEGKIKNFNRKIRTKNELIELLRKKSAQPSNKTA